MQIKRLPLFKSHFSIGKSILTLESPKESKIDEPDSILQICQDAGLDKFFLVEDGMSSYMEAYYNTIDTDLQMVYGVRMSFVNDLEDKDSYESSRHKNIIFANGSQGYYDLVKLYNFASTTHAKDNKNYPVLDYSKCEEFWTENLHFAVPFYDSFLYNNHLYGKSCIPNFSFLKGDITFFEEFNDLPMDIILKPILRSFTKEKGFELLPSQSVFYKDYSDFYIWQTRKCMERAGYNARTLEKPNLDHCGSDTFCFSNCYVDFA